jgi:hypothetical protein
VTLEALILGIASAIIAVASCTYRPDRAQCAEGYYVNGVRGDGRFECLRSPPVAKRDCTQPTGPSLGIVSRIYCTGGSRPIVVDQRTVGCIRRWSE